MSSSHTGILRLYFYLFKTRQLLFRKTDKVVKYLKSWNIWNISRNEYFWKGCMSKQTELFQLGHFLPYLDEEEGEWPSCCLTSRHLLSPPPPGTISKSLSCFVLSILLKVSKELYQPHVGGSRSLYILSFLLWLPSFSMHASIHTKPG